MLDENINPFEDDDISHSGYTFICPSAAARAEVEYAAEPEGSELDLICVECGGGPCYWCQFQDDIIL